MTHKVFPGCVYSTDSITRNYCGASIAGCGCFVRSLPQSSVDQFAQAHTMPGDLLAIEIHAVLPLMDRLRNLFMERTKASISETILKDLKAPFQLYRFSAVWDFPMILLSFLRTQPSITEIHLPISYRNNTTSNLFRGLVENEADLLPRLRSLAADSRITPCLIRSRPVSHVTFLQIPTYENLSIWTFLALSGVPVTSLHYFCIVNALPSWLRMLNLPDSLGVCVRL
ncbi:hypothetical protein BDV93DRAFT_253865 [Ceratobasidium sp. AG-I]|nr:hypothetical protein BDV93DRAFT_253865 [Ceratobasidium sp. AG-I]